MGVPRRHLTFLSIWLHCAVTVPAWAQVALDAVVVEEEREKQADSTASGRVVPAKATPGAATASDALRDVPGLQWFQAGGEGHRITLSIRGVSNQQIQVSWMDVPLNTALGGGVDLSQIPLWGVEELEIYEGGNGLLGASALGGAIRIGDPAHTSPSTAAQIAARTGAWGMFGGRAHGHTDWGGWGTQGGISYHRQDGQFPFVDTNGNNRIREHNGSEAMGWMAGFESPESAGHRALFRTFAHSDSRQMPGVEQYPTPEAYLSQKRWVGTGQWLFQSGYRHQARSGFYGHIRISRYTSPVSFLGGPVRNEMQSSAWGGHSTWRWSVLPSFSIQSRLDGQSESASIDLTGAIQKHVRSQLAGASTAEWSLLRDKVLLAPGIRLEWFNDLGFIALPKAGMTATLAPGLLLRINGSRSFRPPSFEELYFEQGNVRGNPALGAEKGWSADAGLRYGHASRYVQVTYSRLWIDNLILFVPTSVFLIEASDSNAVETHALDVEGRIPLSPNFHWTAAWNRVDARFADSGESLPGRNPWWLGTGLHWNRESLTANVTVQWRAALPLDRFGELEEEERFNVDARGAWRLSSVWRVDLEGRNLLDKRDAVDSLLQPLPGRSVYITTTLNL